MTFRIFASTILIASAVACVVLADSKLTQAQQEALDKCNSALSGCSTACGGQTGAALTGCQGSCQRRYEECLDKAGISYLKSNPTPSPRPRPSATRPPNKSNPTPTPRR